MPKSLEELWNAFIATSPRIEEVPAVKRLAHRAFYAGAIALFAQMTDELAQLPDDDACEALNRYHAEVAQFVVDMMDDKV